MLHVHGDTLIVALYVHDLVIFGNNSNLILGLEKIFTKTFEMNDLGLLHFFLGIQVFEVIDGTFLSKPIYVVYLLKSFKMENYKPYYTLFHLRVKLTK